MNICGFLRIAHSETPHAVVIMENPAVICYAASVTPVWRNPGKYTPPKFNGAPLKNAAWKTILSYGEETWKSGGMLNFGKVLLSQTSWDTHGCPQKYDTGEEEIRRSPVDMAQISHYLQGFMHVRWLTGFPNHQQSTVWCNTVDIELGTGPSTTTMVSPKTDKVPRVGS